MIKLKILSGLLFYPPLVYLGIKYGWQLPVCSFLIILGVLLQLQINKAEK